MTASGAPARRHRKRRVLGVAVGVVLGYFAGVGVAAVLGLAEPWSFGILGIVPALAGFFAGDRRRSRRGG